MIISKTPFRISFFGGGTDYPPYFREHGGSVLATSIDKYCYISCRHLPPFFDHKFRIAYSKIENAKSINDIHHPAVRGVLKQFGVEQGLEIHHDGDLPARSGLGSSSSFVVGLVNALNALSGKFSPKMTLAKEAINIEQNVLKEAVGSQDQVSAAFGGLNRIDFHEDDTFSVRPIILGSDRKSLLDENLLLFFTGITRFASPVAKKKVDNFGEKKRELQQMKDMVSQGIEILGDRSCPLSEFGELLHQAWMYKRELAQGITSSEIDAVYDAALAAGAVGGKLLGAGGGGFILFYVEESSRKSVIDALAPLVHVPFRFESDGSTIAVYQPEAS